MLWMLGSAEPDVTGFRDRYTVLDASEVPAIAVHARAIERRDKESPTSLS
jgi:hypothetical protein